MPLSNFRVSLATRAAEFCVLGALALQQQSSSSRRVTSPVDVRAVRTNVAVKVEYVPKLTVPSIEQTGHGADAGRRYAPQN